MELPDCNCSRLKHPVEHGDNDAASHMLAELEEQVFLPWHEEWVRVRAIGASALESGTVARPQWVESEPDIALEEFAGWLARAADPADVPADDAKWFYFESAPEAPRHWPKEDPGHRARAARTMDADGPLGNVSGRASVLLRMAVAELFPERVRERFIAELARPSVGWPAISDLRALAQVPVEALPPALTTIVAMTVGSDESSSVIHPTWSSHPMTRLERALRRAREASTGRGRAYSRRAHLDEALTIARDNPAMVAAAVDELIARADEEHTQLLVACAHDFAEVRDSLRDAGHRGSAEARGMHLAVTSGDLVSLASTYAWWVDQSLYSVPQVLAAPSGTWLNDVRLEGEVRARLAKAVSRLTESGLSEETELTGALIQLLSLAFDSAAPLPQSVGLEPPVVLSVTSTNSSTHEPIYGADLGVILEIDLPKMATKVGHLVQIKQAINRDTPTEAPKWLISGGQLDDILRHDPTATYWLFAQHGRPPVLSVPAKLLRARMGNESLTVHYDYIRSAAVPVEQELADFILGLWIGSDTQDAVQVASGEDSRHRPRHVLTLRLRQGG